MSVLHSQHISTCSSGQCTTFFFHLSKCGTPLNVLTQAPLLMTQNQWKCVLFLTSYSDLLKKKESGSILKFILTTYLIHSVSHFLSGAVCINTLPNSIWSLFFVCLFVSLYFCLSLFVPIYLCSPVSLFVFPVSTQCSVRFLVSFSNVSIHFYGSPSVARVCESLTKVILFTHPVGGAWFGPYLISVICTCIPPGQHCLDEPKKACMYTWQCLSTLL